MYCPTCGAHQTEDRRFCTTCGTNLSAITAALSGNVAVPRETGLDQLAQAQTDYRRGVASAIQKGAPGLGMLMASLLIFFFLPPGISVWICFGLIIGGVASLGKGVSDFYLAQAELKSAELRAQSTPLYSTPPPAQINSPSIQEPIPQHSVTEHTTRHLS